MQQNVKRSISLLLITCKDYYGEGLLLFRSGSFLITFFFLVDQNYRCGDEIAQIMSAVKIKKMLFIFFLLCLFIISMVLLASFSLHNSFSVPLILCLRPNGLSLVQ